MADQWFMVSFVDLEFSILTRINLGTYRSQVWVFIGFEYHVSIVTRSKEARRGLHANDPRFGNSVIWGSLQLVSEP